MESGIAAALNPSGFQINQAAIDIMTKRVVHTGPKTSLGGFQVGLAIVAYQPLISGVVAIAPRPPAPRQTNNQTTSPSQRVLDCISLPRLLRRRPEWSRRSVKNICRDGDQCRSEFYAPTNHHS